MSRDRALCDPNWKSRQQSTLVQSFGMNLLTSPIKDDSLIHRSTHKTQNNPYVQPAAPKQDPSQIMDYTGLDVIEDRSIQTMTSQNAKNA